LRCLTIEDGTDKLTRNAGNGNDAENPWKKADYNSILPHMKKGNIQEVRNRSTAQSSFNSTLAVENSVIFLNYFVYWLFRNGKSRQITLLECILLYGRLVQCLLTSEYCITLYICVDQEIQPIVKKKKRISITIFKKGRPLPSSSVRLPRMIRLQYRF